MSFRNTQAVARKLWVAALRSGKYKQGRGKLHSGIGGGKFCCLGVACEVFLEHENHDKLPVSNAPIWVGNGTRQRVDKIYDGDCATLPKVVQDWLGLKDFSGSFQVGTDDEEATLIQMNDREKKSFDEIAAVIESKPKGLFRRS